MRVYIFEDLIKWPLNENEKFVRTLFYVFDDKLYQICFPSACVQIIVKKRFKTGAGALRINKYRNVYILYFSLTIRRRGDPGHENIKSI